MDPTKDLSFTSEIFKKYVFTEMSKFFVYFLKTSFTSASENLASTGEIGRHCSGSPVFN